MSSSQLPPPLTLWKNQSELISYTSEENVSFDLGKDQDKKKTSMTVSNETEVQIGPFGPNNSYHQQMSEFQRFIAHQDFGLYILLASKVKVIRNNLLCGTVPDTLDVVSITHIESREGKNEVDEMANLIQTRLLLGSNTKINISNVIVPRGTFYRTDDLMEESIVSLTREFNKCMTWYNALKEQSPPKSPPKKKGKKRNNDAIVVKYSKRQTDILTNWMIDHKSHPFPTALEIAELSQAAGLNKSQVVNWTTNVRKRNLKATVEKGKKPHHFLDFLFLANDRDQRLLEGNNNQSSNTTSKTTRKTTSRTKQGKKTASKKQNGFKKTRSYTNQKGGKTRQAKKQAVIEQTNPQVNFERAFNPATPLNMTMQQYSTPIAHGHMMNYAPMQQSFIPHFHPGPYLATRQITPPRFQQCHPPIEVVSNPSHQRPHLDTKEISPIPISEFHKMSESTAMEIDHEAEVINEYTQDGLISTPPRCEVDDMLWGVELDSDISMKDVFRDSFSDVEPIDGVVSMDEGDGKDNKNDSITESDVLQLFNDDDDDLEMFKIEV